MTSFFARGSLYGDWYVHWHMVVGLMLISFLVGAIMATDDKPRA